MVYFLLTELFHSRYGREYADHYLGHGIGPVTGYGVSMSNFFYKVKHKHTKEAMSNKLHYLFTDCSIQKWLQQICAILSQWNKGTILFEYGTNYLRLLLNMSMTMNSLCKRTNIIRNLRRQ